MRFSKFERNNVKRNQPFSRTEPIKNVLIICSQAYKEKADNRVGGVGDEATIISPEVYGKATQEKFIPVLIGEGGSENCVPAFIKSRIYIDLSDDDKYEEGYELLVRHIYGKPENKRPALGPIPHWLKDENPIHVTMRTLTKNISNLVSKNQDVSEIEYNKFICETWRVLENLKESIDSKNLLEKITELDAIRKYFFEIAEKIIQNDNSSTFFISFFENIYNKNNRIKPGIIYRDQVDFVNFFLWSQFVYVIAMLIYFKKYTEVRSLLTHTYFLSVHGSIQNETFTRFCTRLHSLEEKYKEIYNPRLMTLSGELLIKYEKYPYVTKEHIVNTDIILFQLSNMINHDDIWYPRSYVYWDPFERQEFWIRMASREYCSKIFPLLGVTSLEELKNLVSAPFPDQIQKSQARYQLPAITYNIPVDKIGTLP